MNDDCDHWPDGSTRYFGGPKYRQKLYDSYVVGCIRAGLIPKTIETFDKDESKDDRKAD